ncbi:helix-turn-helix transcriptional regulator [Microbacterium esteraromaticum]|uniref:Helix-turn-helix transcriptional regulator n=1 Tax=Microbacterium esteraromaticum TaxID=57043 RepID=A0A7D7WG26_9MICO|nr:AraC family transcriptional regulator [Microbacterium esteraromaticum]QMU96634.1 helix-turn-helix transcriptional regulator [Microbacterium esteraromaticum]
MSLLAPAPAALGARGDALEKLLGAIAVSIRSQRRHFPPAGDTIPLASDGLSLVYVLAGEVSLPRDAGLPDGLSAGDALLLSGARPIPLRIPAGSGVLVSHLALADGSAHVAPLLPDVAWIRSFEELEPAAAALAQHMGTDAPVVCDRDGDLVICRMMATTLLQSVIRAWSSACAPQGWPSLSDDPFLDRVVDAVNADPGREWTVEQMASISALSRSVFAERFRAAFDLSPAQYVAEVRMRAARALLIDGRGVSEVSRELGYASDEGFSRAFRRHTGLTPSAWRTRASLASA